MPLSSKHQLRDWVLPGIVYYLTGIICLQVSHQAGYATLIWIPAGVALAAVLLWGYRTLPSLWLGSLAIRLTSGEWGSESSLEIAALLALASVLQAVLGAYLIRAFASFPLRFTSVDGSLRFLIAAGPLSCLCASFLSCWLLWSTEVLSPDQFAFVFFFWWLGDVVGVTVILPVLLALCGSRETVEPVRRLPLAGASLAALLIFVALLSVQRAHDSHLQGALSEGQVQLFENAIQGSIDRHMTEIESFVSLQVSDNPLSGTPSVEQLTYWQATYPGLIDYGVYSGATILGMTRLPPDAELELETLLAKTSTSGELQNHSLRGASEKPATVILKPMLASNMPALQYLVVSTATIIESQLADFFTDAFTFSSHLGDDRPSSAATSQFSVRIGEHSYTIALQRKNPVAYNPDLVLIIFLPLLGLLATLSYMSFVLQHFGYTAYLFQELSSKSESSQEANALLTSLIHNVPMYVSLQDASGRFLVVNQDFLKLYNLSEDVAGKLPSEILPDSVIALHATQEREVRKSKQPNTTHHTVELNNHRKDFLSVKFPILDAAGEVDGIGSFNLDITESTSLRENLSKSEGLLKSLVREFPNPLVARDLNGRFLFANQAWFKTEGEPFRSLDGVKLEDVLPAERAGLYALQDSAVLHSNQSWSGEETITIDGQKKILQISKFPLRDEQGNVFGVAGTSMDLTEHRKTQEIARQAAKMESLGQLTGGISHDFNNLLAVMLGNAEMLRIEGTDHEVCVEEIIAGAHRGLDLTKRLLAFSSRQAVSTEVVNLPDLFSDLRSMISRTLGETISVHMRCPADLWSVECDLNQFENALLNLAINARDAMPLGGTLTFACTNVSSGSGMVSEPKYAGIDFVRLDICDTGHGMSEDVLERVFEPFFTTKDVGAGTGLGLSMVHGFATQSGGFVSVESTPGVGSTISLWLPKTAQIMSKPAARNAEQLVSGQNEHILLLEDDEHVRGSTKRLLEKLNYRITSAENALEGRTRLHEKNDIDLVISDVVLPGGVSGPEFAVELSKTHPSIRTILISGYAPESIVGKTPMENNIPLVEKPFSAREFSQVVRGAFSVT